MAAASANSFLESKVPGMTELHSKLADNFSLTQGGPMHRVLLRLGYEGDERGLVVSRAVFVVLFTWLPLLILSLVQGVAYGHAVHIPFLRDFVVNIRFLIALPILILAESGIDNAWRTMVREFLKSGLVDAAELPAFESVIEKSNKLRDRLLPELVMILIAYSAPLFLGRTEVLMTGITNWHALGGGDGNLSMAGWWFRIISTPLFRFLLLRWFWRMVLWTYFLWQVSRIRLYLVATHTDMAAGLGFLTEAQKAFSPIVFAGGAVIAASLANAVAYEGQTLSSLKFPVIGYLVLAIGVLVAPLLLVAPTLMKVKRRALREYGALVTIHNQQFDSKWIRRDPDHQQMLLGNPDASSLVDLGSSFAVVRQMNIVPIDKPTLISLAVAGALPVIPVILIFTPADEIVHAVVKMLG